MRIFLEVIENVTDSVRVIVGFVVLLITVCTMIFAFGVSYVASGATEEFAATAEELGKEAIKAQREAELNRELAKGGWGYQAVDAGPGEPTGPDDNSTGEWGSDDWAGGS